MFSALKKLVVSEAGQQRDKNIPAGLQSMNQSLQRRFAKGVQYNMKIVIRGDRNTGKSTLWHRLQGRKFLEEYIPTQEIQVTSIHWNYKTTDDVVKVEVWDVVDKGQKYPLPEGLGKGKKKGDSLKLENEPQEAETELALDAEFLDVYKNCNGVIMMFDITKQWTFNYIIRELPKVPSHVPVCVLGNQRDMGEHRVILPDDIRDFIVGLNRPLGSSYIHYAESSMKNGFGLKYLHRFFNIPFLQLQRETLLRQLETNQLDIDATLEELTVQQETEDQNYDIFLERMESRAANGQSPSSGSQSPIVPPSAPSTATPSPGTPQAGVNPHILLASPPCAPPPPLATPAPAPQTQPPAQSLERPPQPATPPGPAAQAPPTQKRGFISRLFGAASTEGPTADAPPPKPQGNVQSVDDFVPDDGLDRSFLEDSGTGKAKAKPTATVDSDSDGEGRGGNPLVAGFQDDLDPDDKAPSRRGPSATSQSTNVTLSSDEEEPHLKTPAAPMGEDGKRPPINTVIQPIQTKEAENKLPATLPGKRASLPTAATSTRSARHGKKKGGAAESDSSDTDPEAPVAKQLLSFVMDDPDFESEESDTQKINKDIFPVRDDPSDLSDEELLPHKVTAPPESLKPAVVSFKNKDTADLFGLGLEETPARVSSDDQDDKLGKQSSKEKKKKKKSKEEDEKGGKKRHKHKKKVKEETGTAAEKEKEREKEKEKEKEKKKKPKTKKTTDVDDLEAFLAGVEGPVKSGGGDYEEL
ncbi:rab-like protein 6 isoform X3 [Paramormyrops kingsleyae]|uniref:RAB, member RAS onco family like 6 n=1 Tax=Paramormyrops kingsleyae TaxID=1676925 RepID=A0A3B3S003_9TELE|nr:rab-like protein 6 isoform X3 [Paramormyrops kingsleyae]